MKEGNYWLPVVVGEKNIHMYIYGRSLEGSHVTTKAAFPFSFFPERRLYKEGYNNQIKAFCSLHHYFKSFHMTGPSTSCTQCQVMKL